MLRRQRVRIIIVRALAHGKLSTTIDSPYDSSSRRMKGLKVGVTRSPTATHCASPLDFCSQRAVECPLSAPVLRHGEEEETADPAGPKRA